MKPWTIAIDGPAGAGKSTVAKLLATHLGYLYIDSGAMYRAVALLAERNEIPATETDAIAALARTAHIEFQQSDIEGVQCILLNGEDVTEDIRAAAIATQASLVSAIPGVRSAMVAQQQAIGAQGGVVMEGRDIGTVVFPEAELKVFLTASPDERAERRHRDLLARGDAGMTLEQVRADQDERDHRDSTRTIAPLVPAEDALLLESDGKTPEEIVEEIREIIDKQGRGA